MSEEEQGGSQPDAEGIMLTDVKEKKELLSSYFIPKLHRMKTQTEDNEKADNCFKEIPVIKSRFTKSQEPKDFASMIPKTCH